MKSILIVSHALEIGGAERALLAMLESFDYSQYSVELFLMRHSGDLLKLIPPQVKLLPEKKPYTALAVPLVSILKKGMLRVAVGRVFAKLRAKYYCKRHHIQGENAVELEYSHKYTVKGMPVISDKKYDLVISFLTPHYFAAEKTHAKTKIAWIHTDYSFVNVDVESEKKMWDRYDHIMSISDDCTKGFVSKFPALASKIVLMENIIVPSFLQKQAALQDVKQEMPGFEGLNLLSVGRFSHAKNFDNVPDLCRRILAQGIQIRWYLIGYGSDEALIRQKIRETGMENHVIVLGKKSNPYPYMAACDVYVQPSRYEGRCVAVQEAQALGKPVIITAYPTSASQLQDGVDGVIVPQDNEACAVGIATVLKNPQMLEKLVHNCAEHEYSNAQSMEPIYSIMKG